MLRKNLILSLLLFAYTIVLGHNIIPHGHFDDIFTTEHHHDSDDHHDSHHDSDHEHNYPFSHSVTLHVAIEKQTVFTSHSVKYLLKKVPFGSILNSLVNFQPLQDFSISALIFYDYAHPPIHVCSSSFSNRPPPFIIA
jgi:hypothetical protein